MTSKNRKLKLGPAMFSTAAAGILVFFWWLLIYDHGIRIVH